MFRTIQRLKNYIHTIVRNAAPFFSGNFDGLPIQRIGQGNGVASKLTKTPGKKFYRCYIKIRIHSIGKCYIATTPTLYTNFNKC